MLGFAEFVEAFLAKFARVTGLTHAAERANVVVAQEAVEKLTFRPSNCRPLLRSGAILEGIADSQSRPTTGSAGSSTFSTASQDVTPCRSQNGRKEF